MVEHDRAPSSIELLKEQLKSTDQNTRLAAIEELGKDRSVSAVKALIDVVNAKQPNRLLRFIPTGTPPNLQEQLSAITSLSQIDDDRANRFIMKLCQNESRDYLYSTTDESDYGGLTTRRVYDTRIKYNEFPNAKGQLAEELNFNIELYVNSDEPLVPRTTDIRVTLSDKTEIGGILLGAYERVEQRLET